MNLRFLFVRVREHAEASITRSIHANREVHTMVRNVASSAAGSKLSAEQFGVFVTTHTPHNVFF